MIGTLILQNGTRATLDVDGWQSNDRSLEQKLNAAYDLRRASPSDGVLGWRQLSQAASDLNGKASYVKQPPCDLNVIY